MFKKKRRPGWGRRHTDLVVGVCYSKSYLNLTPIVRGGL